MNCVAICNQINQINKEYIIGDSLSIQSIGMEKEIRGDIELKKMEEVTIWGTVKDLEGKPVYGECVRLVKIKEEYGRVGLEVVDYTLTDETGAYRLDAYGIEGGTYNVMVDTKESIHVNQEEEMISNIKEKQERYNKTICPHEQIESDTIGWTQNYSCRQEEIKHIQSKARKNESEEIPLIRYTKKTYSGKIMTEIQGKSQVISQYTVFSK